MLSLTRSAAGSVDFTPPLGRSHWSGRVPAWGPSLEEGSEPETEPLVSSTVGCDSSLTCPLSSQGSCVSCAVVFHSSCPVNAVPMVSAPQLVHLSSPTVWSPFLSSFLPRY